MKLNIPKLLHLLDVADESQGGFRSSMNQFVMAEFDDILIM